MTELEDVGLYLECKTEGCGEHAKVEFGRSRIAERSAALAAHADHLKSNPHPCPICAVPMPAHTWVFAPVKDTT